ncbi:MAG: hypothetical protein D6696_06080 [Acidobacteria bacterium]|nr:MAG: hypothetical protein D6696_06080 [Acidobacteriota bacterium]
MSKGKTATVDIEQVIALAKQFLDRNLFDEAAAFFEIAQRLDPDNLGLKLSLAQVRNQQRQRRGEHQMDLGKNLLEHVRRNAIDAFQFFGLAALYEERGKRAQAEQCLEIARAKGVVNPFVHKLHGKILFAKQEFDAAADELRRARRYNPFDRELVELLSRAEYEREHYPEALEAAIDAFWLLKEGEREHRERLKKRIRRLKTILRMSQEDLVTRFHEQRDKLQTAFDRLEWQRERLLEDRGDDAGPPQPSPHAGRIELAARLRRMPPLDPLDDVELFQLTEVTHAEQLAPGEALFEHGRLRIERRTGYGVVALGHVARGSLLGEIGFVAGAERSADAVADEACVLLRLDAGELEQLVAGEPALGVKLYQIFWQDLATKLRQTNEQLRTFFSGDERPPAEPSAEPPGHERPAVGTGERLELLEEQGLSGVELATLANFSDVKRFPKDTRLFREGDEGKEMYVVLEGQVRISKFIPGGGEEALAILDRGDFFGEMSLIDGQPRSADAIAHDGPATVVAFDQRTLEEVLTVDPSTALPFMRLLCRLIAGRLREVDEKLTTWRIMAGAPDDDPSAFDTRENNPQLEPSLGRAR